MAQLSKRFQPLRRFGVSIPGGEFVPMFGFDKVPLDSQAIAIEISKTILGSGDPFLGRAVIPAGSFGEIFLNAAAGLITIRDVVPRRAMPLRCSESIPSKHFGKIPRHADAS